MKRVLTAVVLVPLVLLAIFKAPLWLFAALTAIFGTVAAWEYLHIAKKYDSATPARAGLLQALLLFLLLTAALRTPSDQAAIAATSAAVVVILLYPLGLLAWQMRQADFRHAVLGTALAAFVVPYVVIPFVSLVVVRSMPSGWFFLILLFFLVWSGDIFAYYVGKTFGKRLLAPRVSPKKTWEGTIASVLGSALVSWLLCVNAARLEEWLRSIGALPSDSVFGMPATLHAPPVWVAIGIAIVVNVVAQLGDLAESMIKRGVDVKDSGSILPGHGGMLDRVDALLFAAPVGMLLFQVTRHYFLLR